MDESWRIRIGSSATLPRRKSTEETSAHRIFDFPSDHSTLDAEDFHDVFGGPPKTVLARKTSASDFNISLYHDVFRSSEMRKNLEVFRVPSDGEGRRRGVYERSEGFYDDIFGSDEDGRSRSSKVKVNSKSRSSSSVLSSEDLSPLRPSISEDVFFSSYYSSKLRPVNIPSQRNTSSTVLDERQNVQMKSDTPPWLRPPSMESHFPQNNLTKNYKTSAFKYSRSSSSQETFTMEPNTNCGLKAPVEDIEIDSPSSMVSSLCNRDPENKPRVHDKALQEEEEDDIMSSYVIEINCEKRKETEDESVMAINEAIAWAKEKFQRQNTEATGGGGHTARQTVSPSATESFLERRGRFVAHEHCNQQRDVAHEHCNQQRDGYGIAQFLLVNEKLRNWIAEEQKPTKAAGCL